MHAAALPGGLPERRPLGAVHSTKNDEGRFVMMVFLSWLPILIVALTTLASAAPRKGGPVTTFETFDVSFPDTSFTVVTGSLPGTLVGAYVDRFGRDHGFVQEGAAPPQVLLRVTPQDASLAGVTGFFRDSAATSTGLIITRSFIYHEGSFQTLQVPRTGPGQPFSTLTEASGHQRSGSRLWGLPASRGWEVLRVPL